MFQEQESSDRRVKTLQRLKLWRRTSSSETSPNDTTAKPAEVKPTSSIIVLRSASPPVQKSSNFGINVLHDDGDEAGVDIVFVHGLNGCAFNTWHHKHSGVHWPSELLKQDVPDARILSFGYNANSSGFFETRSQSRLTNHAEELVDQLERIRQRTNTTSRKLCFVAHSLGGLVTAQALNHSRASADKHLQQIERCTVTIVFLGVPHCGSDLARWEGLTHNLAMAAGGRSMPRELIGTLKPNSELLISVQNGFSNLLRSREKERCAISLACLYEKRPILNGIIVRHNGEIILCAKS